MNDNLTDFGTKVKVKLLEKGLSQRVFCNKNNIPYKYFTEILHGRKALTKSKYMAAIKRTLGLDKSDKKES